MVDLGAICPECQSEDTDCYDESEGSDYVDKKRVCNACETAWTAHYKLTFVDHQWIDGGVSS